MKNLSLFPNHCSEKNASESDILGVTNDTDDARIAKIDECQMLQKRICIGLSIGKILFKTFCRFAIELPYICGGLDVRRIKN